METETAKGLHFVECRYSPIRRTSTFTAQSESFEARNGRKAMKSLDARGITATFDPWGVFVRQCFFFQAEDDIRDLRSGTRSMPVPWHLHPANHVLHRKC